MMDMTAVDAVDTVDTVDTVNKDNRKESCIGCCDGNQEVKAFSWESLTQGITLQGAAFYAVAVVNLSKQEAGCEIGTKCNNRIYGIQAESILTFTAAVSGFIAAILMPLCGAVVDHTKYRRGVALWTAVGLIISAALKSVLSEKTLLFCLMIMALTPLVLQTHLVAVTAYMHEFTKEEKRLAKYMGLFVALRSVASLFMMLIVLGLARFVLTKPEGSISHSVNIAKLAQVIDVIISSILFIPTYLYRGFLPRPAQSKPEKSLVRSAVSSLYKTSKNIIIRDNPALKWFLVSSFLIGMAQSAASVIALSYVINFLHMTSTQVSIVVFVYSTCKIIGAIAFRVLCKRWCILRSLKIVIFIYSISLIICSLVIKGPQHIYLMYIFVMIWSALFGWVLPSMRTIYLKIIPSGEQAQYMGLYLFFSNGFVWIPNLIATLLLNVFQASWGVVLGTFSAYTMTSLVTLHFMGSYTAAKQYASDEAEATDSCLEDDDNKIDVEKDVTKSTTTVTTERIFTQSILTISSDNNNKIN